MYEWGEQIGNLRMPDHSYFVSSFKSPQTMQIAQDGPANALALNKDHSQVVIAGRSVFKVFNIDDEFVECHNLRVGKNLNLNFSCNHVAWSTLDDAILATAATNGAVVIWNLNRPTRSKQEHVFNEHKRTVNKVCFHPTDITLLLSGSQDGTMKWFDLRGKEVVQTFESNSESVRDIQFCPLMPHIFSSVSDNGSVQIWDLRKADRYTTQFAAHSGPIFSCDWHPELQWLATASRDKTIKVWDLNVKPTLEFTIHTFASIGHIKWRPQRRFHIASCALVVDANINVWDVRRPYIPYAVFDQHKDVATGIAWRGSPNVFLSTSKDCLLVQHVFADGKHPLDSGNPQGVSISGNGDILFATKTEPDPDTEPFLQASSHLQTFTSHDPLQEANAFIECAKKYVLSGKSFEDLCEINSKVALDSGRSHVALVWKTIQTIYKFDSDDFVLLRNEELPMDKGASKVMSSCDASEVKSLRGLDPTNMEEDGEMIDELEFTQAHRVPEMQAQGDFFFGDGEPDPLSADQLEASSRFQPDWTLKAEAFVTRHEIVEGPAEHYGEPLEPSPQAESTSVTLFVNALPSLPPLRLTDTVLTTLHHHVEQGDLQTSVAVLAVLGDRRRDLNLSLQTQEHWLLTYIDLLSRYQLFEQCAELIRIAWLPSIGELSQQSTTVYTTCGSCNKLLQRSGWLCDRCRTMSVCALCHQVVRGLIVWCQGCAHGGHIAHMESWFKDNEQCPTGCGHTCEYG